MKKQGTMGDPAKGPPAPPPAAPAEGAAADGQLDMWDAWQVLEGPGNPQDA